MTKSKKPVEIIGVPIDLGANMRGANIGPAAIRIAGLKRKLLDLDYEVIDSGDLQVPIRDALPPSAEAEHYVSYIAAICNDLAQRVEAALENNHSPLIIGGDHCLAMGSIAGASQFLHKQGSQLGVIWVDAHADINTFETSPSGNVHGMPLSVVMGQGDKRLTDVFLSNQYIRPQNVALIGIRNIDGKEKQAVKKSGIHYYSMREIDEKGMHKVMESAINAVSKDASHIHLSFDLDGVDPLYAPGVSTAVTGGLSYREAHLALEMLADTGKLLTCEFVELNPINDQAHKTALLAVELVQSAFGKAIV